MLIEEEGERGDDHSDGLAVAFGSSVKPGQAVAQ
jgi:hypothetical protein